ncbi:hypothetical protein FB451DRAFT_1233693 [Mycena latifolia]|nr:hypothetical protein FB451DRAFT_1233693 [Mycena latifolia]
MRNPTSSSHHVLHFPDFPCYVFHHAFDALSTILYALLAPRESGWKGSPAVKLQMWMYILLSIFLCPISLF